MLAAAVCAQEKQVVRDSAGNAVQTNEQYFMQPINTVVREGGFIPLPVKLPLCPLGINILPDSPSVPVSFGYPYPPVEDTNVYTKEFVNSEFKSEVWSFCTEFSKLWVVDESSSASDEPAILIDGKQLEGNSWFKFERLDHFVGGYAYKLSTTFDGIIGTIPGPWSVPKLVLTNDTAKTLHVKFIKVDDDTTATTSTSRGGKLGRRMFPLY